MYGRSPLQVYLSNTSACDSERANKMGWVGGRSERAMKLFGVESRLAWVGKLRWVRSNCAVQWGVNYGWACACWPLEESCMEGDEDGESKRGISQLTVWNSHGLGAVPLFFPLRLEITQASHGVLGVLCCRGRYRRRRFGRDCSPAGGVHQPTAEIHTLPGTKLRAQRDRGTAWTAQRHLRARSTQPSGGAEMRRQLPQ